MIFGKFNSTSVRLSDEYSFGYLDLLRVWESFDRNRKLTVWAIGDGARGWLERAIQSYDFDVFEIMAMEDNQCIVLGETAPDECQLIRVDVYSKVVDNTTVIEYNIDDKNY